MTVCRKGKVRDIVEINDTLVLTTTDRISAFDKVITTIPGKGILLNKLSVFWFNKTSDIIENHLIQELNDSEVKVRKCEVIPLEIIVRGYLYGSLFKDYTSGNFYKLPKGMKEYDGFIPPIVTPTTKSEIGHDEKITIEEIISKGIVPKKIWDEIEKTSLLLYDRGSQISKSVGLKLIDTKYEFGIHNNKLVLIDEIHTPDSSRYLYNNEHYDKEYFRKWLRTNNFENKDEIFVPDAIKNEIYRRYNKVYSLLVGA
jgi:phosphoribosylaminoimidazole-succinocarboxamide synthase